MVRLVSLTAAAALALAPVRASAEDALETARGHIGVLQYAEAEAALEAFLAAGKARPAEVVEAYRLLGRVRAGLGDEAGAEEAFARLVALDPGASLPPGSSPKLTEPFARARARAGAGIALSRELDPQRRAVVLVVERDPLDMVAGARLLSEPGGAMIEQRGADRLVLSPPPEATRVVLVAIDAAGNELVALPAVDLAIAAAPALAQRAEGTPLWARWQLWAGAGVLFAAAGAGFGLAAAGAEDELDELTGRAASEPYTVEFAAAERAERRAERFSVAANAGYALAAASGVAAIVFAWRGAGDEDRGAALEAAVTAGGAAVTATWRF